MTNLLETKDYRLEDRGRPFHFTDTDNLYRGSDFRAELFRTPIEMVACAVACRAKFSGFFIFYWFSGKNGSTERDVYRLMS